MALRKDITARILDLLRQNPQGLSITEIVRNSDVNRNTAGRYLDNLLISGQVEMRHFGMAKIYSYSRRLPVSSVLSLSSEFVMQVDTGLRVVFLNKPFALLLGTEEKEITGKNIEFTRIPPFFDETYPVLLTSIREGLTGTEFHGEMDLSSCGRSFSYRVVPIVFTHGQKGVSVIFDDITDRRRNDALLKESEEKFRALFNNASDMITLHALTSDMVHGHYIEVNDVTCRKLKYTREELLGMTPRDLVAPDSMTVVNRSGRMLLENGHATSEAVLLTKDHQRIPVEINVHRFEFKGKPVALAIIRDITERIAAEQEKRQNEERNRFIAEHSVDIIHRLDPDCVLLYTSPSVRTLLGYAPEEVLGKPVLGMIHPEDLPGVMRDILVIKESGQQTATSTFRFRHKEGHYILFESTTRVLRDATGRITEYLNISRDISKRLQGLP